MPMNPWFTNSFVDSCAFDPKYDPEDKAATEIFRLYRDEGLGIRLTHSNQKEIEHPNTPKWGKVEAQNLVYTLEVGLTRDERIVRGRIHVILAGRGKPEKVWQDACHIFEAQKYGSCFVTTDRRLLKCARKIHAVCGAEILLPTEFLELARNSRRRRVRNRSPLACQDSTVI